MGIRMARLIPSLLAQAYHLGNIFLQPIAAISIRGLVVDSRTDAPIPYASVRLLICQESICSDVGYQSNTDFEGMFRFNSDFYWPPLEAGTYQVIASANGYQDGQTDPFPVGEGDAYDVGNIPLEPTAQIGSISGRVVDALTGNPLPGNTDPLTFVWLLRCLDDFVGCFQVSFQPTDADGWFSFSTSSAMPLEVGTYQVAASAQEYRQGQTDRFAVGEEEHKNIGDLTLQPLPFEITEIRACGDLPPEGGTCSYSVRVANRLGIVVDGAAWSLVSSMSGSGSTAFQTAKPQQMRLAPGRSKVVRFEFGVPNTVTDGAFICTQVYVGEDRLQPFFNVVEQRGLFCITKKAAGAFSVLPEQETQKMFRQMSGRP
jgi:hypothetical protein